VCEVVEAGGGLAKLIAEECVDIGEGAASVEHVDDFPLGLADAEVLERDGVLEDVEDLTAKGLRDDADVVAKLGLEGTQERALLLELDLSEESMAGRFFRFTRRHGAVRITRVAYGPS